MQPARRGNPYLPQFVLAPGLTLFVELLLKLPINLVLMEFGVRQ